MTLTEQDFDTLKDANLKSFSERVSRIAEGDCTLFNMEVNRLETQALQLYGLVALLVRHEDDLAKISSVWGAMERVCDAFATRLSEVCSQHPYCQASHDKLLDLRNRCSRLRQLHA